MTGGSVGLGRGHWSPGSNNPLETADNLDAVLRRFVRGEFDLIGTARAVLSDAAWARKLQNGEPWSPYEPASLRAVM
jgi:2,4-dienoyl-CoA reductase-like NADH-dependent reductase (Old Yellow Enzyme family)